MEAGKTGKLGQCLPCKHENPELEPTTVPGIQPPLTFGLCEAPPTEQTEQLGSDTRSSRSPLGLQLFYWHVVRLRR